MDRRMGLQVINTIDSQVQVGALVMLLGEVNSERQLPIITGPTGAQATVLHLKGVKTPYLLTHGLLITSLTMLETNLVRILIYKTGDGIFYSYIYLEEDEGIICIDAWTSNAVALAVCTDCPILIYESILEQECFHISLEGRTHLEKTNNDEVAEEKHDLPDATSKTLEEVLE